MMTLQNLIETFRRVLHGTGAVTVRDSHFGYIIRSERPVPGETRLQEALAWVVLIGMLAVAAALWFVPFFGVSYLGLIAADVLIVALGLVAFFLIRAHHGGIELHVDLNRRELRSAVVTPRRESWIQSCARFSDVAEVCLRQPRPQQKLQSLSLRILGETELMPVAVGSEAILLSLHDRLARDLRAASSRPMGGLPHVPSSMSSRSQVFPSLGPGEIKL